MQMNKFNKYILQISFLALMIFFAQSSAHAQAPIRASYDSNPYKKDPTKSDSWKWTGETERTIYNPLDGGVLLAYTMEYQGDSDGCSKGLAREKALFLQACLAHDANYDAPFPLAGFPGYPNGGSIGQEIADYLFYKDMQFINNNARANNNGFDNWINDSAADAFYAGVTVGGNFRSNSNGKTISTKGGVVAVLNNGAYIMTLKVKWKDRNGLPKSAEVTKPVGQTAVIPLSYRSKDIKIECSAVGGKTIFTQEYASIGMYAFTVNGTTLINSVETGLTKNNAKNTFRAPDAPNGQRSIKFQSEAGFVSDMAVSYFVYQKIGGKDVMTLKTVVTDKITAGISKAIVIPNDSVPNTNITVSIRGYGTVKNSFFSATVPGNFTGQHCYKAWGTIFSPQGGKCT